MYPRVRLRATDDVLVRETPQKFGPREGGERDPDDDDDDDVDDDDKSMDAWVWRAKLTLRPLVPPRMGQESEKRNKK